MSVSDMLTYAGLQSRVGDTTRYGHVKATRELAKNTFDAVNNGVAFTCL